MSKENHGGIKYGRGPYPIIEDTYPSDPKYMSKAARRALIELVQKNKDSENLIVVGSKIQMYTEGFGVNFEYDVKLSGKHLCTIYEAPNKRSYVLEFQDTFYSYAVSDEAVIYHAITDRWIKDEEKRKRELYKKTNESYLNFLKSFEQNYLA